MAVVCSALLPWPHWLVDRLLLVTVTLSVISLPLSLTRLHLRWLPLLVLATALLRLGLLAQLSRAVLCHSPLTGWTGSLGRLAMGGPIDDYPMDSGQRLRTNGSAGPLRLGQ